MGSGAIRRWRGWGGRPPGEGGRGGVVEGWGRGRAKGRAPAVTDDQAQAMSALVVEAIGELSKRDQLPYTAAFDRIVVAFNTQAGLSFDPHQVWRVVAKLAK